MLTRYSIKEESSKRKEERLVDDSYKVTGFLLQKYFINGILYMHKVTSHITGLSQKSLRCDGKSIEDR